MYLKFALIHLGTKNGYQKWLRIFSGQLRQEIYARKINKIWVNELEIYGPNYINVPEIYDLKNRKARHRTPNYIIES